jgi:hypothetical protein
MKQGISNIVGQAHDASGESVPLYCALRPLSCSACGTNIPEGELFTRHALPEQELLLYAHCRKCTPFNPQSDRHARSELLDALLASPDNNEDQPTKRQQRSITEAVEKRLGAALEQARRARSRRDK